MDISTIHIDTNSVPFVYSSIPIPFLYGNSLMIKYSPIHFEINVGGDVFSKNVSSFDCFQALEKEELQSHFDFVGILLVTTYPIKSVR